jgi:hypothetical protein
MVYTKLIYKYKITQDDIDRGRATVSTNGVGISTITVNADNGVGLTTSFVYNETGNFLPVPPSRNWR